MELRVLRYYLTVAREENITRAADMLHITQPTLSRQMAELEEELHTRLFERTNRKIVLTESGMLLRRRAEELISLADKVQQEFQSGDELMGLISIGSGVTAAVSACLPELLQDYAQKYSRVRFELHTGTAAAIKDQLDKGLLDIGIPHRGGKIRFRAAAGQRGLGHPDAGGRPAGAKIGDHPRRPARPPAYRQLAHPGAGGQSMVWRGHGALKRVLHL